MSIKRSLPSFGPALKCDLYRVLSKIESNVITNPSIQTVTKITKGLGISIDDLIKQTL